MGWNPAPRADGLGGIWEDIGLPSRAFSSTIALDAPGAMTAAGSGILFLTHTPGGVDGVEQSLLIPAGQYTGGIVFAESLNQSGDAFDSTRDFLIVMQQFGARVKAATFSVAAPWVGALTMTSAIVANATPAAINVTFPRLVHVANPGGVTLSGVSETISSIVGDGTTTPTLNLSASLVHGDAPQIVVAANAIVDLNGHALAAGSYAVTNNVVDPDLDSLTGLAQVYDGTSTLDMGTGNLVANIHNAAIAQAAAGSDYEIEQATGGNQATLIASDSDFSNARSIGAPGVAGVRYTLLGGGTPDLVTNGFSYHIVMKFPLVLSSAIGFFFGRSANANPTLIALSGNISMFDGSAKSFGSQASLLPTSGIHVLALTVTQPGLANLYVDGMAVGTANVSVTALATSPVEFFGQGSSQGLQNKWACIAVYKGAQSPTDVATVRGILKNNHARGYGLT